MPTKQSYQAIVAQIEKLQQQAEEIRSKERQGVIAEIVKAMTEHGIGLAELREAMGDARGTGRGRKAHTGPGRGAGKGKSETRKVGAKVKPKYRNPESGETWTGRGRAPRWLVEAESAGKRREEFLIAGQ